MDSQAELKSEYVTAKELRDRCLVGDKSFLFPNEAVWTGANLRQLLDAITQAPDTAGDATYMEKLRSQVEGLPNACTLIAADALVFYYLFPNSESVKDSTKRDRIATVLSWHNTTPPALLASTFDGGIGTPGTHYQQLPNQIVEAFIQFALVGKERQSDFDSPSDCEALLQELRSGSLVPIEFPHVLLHLFFPDRFEAIVSDRHKRFIAARWGGSATGSGASTDQGLDATLRSIRAELTPIHGEGFNYYSPDIRRRWDPDLRERERSILPESRKLYIAPASFNRAADNIVLSLAYPINTIRVEEYIIDAITDDIRAKSGNGQIYAWGARDTEALRRIWHTMEPGDWILFYGEYNYNFVARIIAIYELPDFAAALWKPNEDVAESQPLVYFVTQPSAISVHLDEVAAFLGTSPHRSLKRVSEDVIARIELEYVSLQAFIERAFMPSAERYLSLRSNVGSAWDDREGSSYHFDRDVPNYTQVRPGAHFLVERRFNEGYKLVGQGTIGEVQRDISRDGETSFVANYATYDPISPPKLLTDNMLAALRKLERYNNQHSIHVLDRSTFDLLAGKRNPVHPPLDPAADLAAAIHWDKDRARSLIDLALRSKQVLFSGPPGSGKTFIATALADVLTAGGVGSVSLVQFHPSYAYEDFIEGIRPQLESTAPEGGGSVKYSLVPGAFRRFVSQAQDDPGRRYVFVIDELNRANVATVFGELLFCLEYRGPSFRVELPYSHERFFIPENVWILGTMNSADRSIALIDAAFRRRFKHVSLPPDYSVLAAWLIAHGQADSATEIVQRLRALNAHLAPIIGGDRLIGHSYLMTADVNGRLEDIWHEDIFPVLAEHLYGRDDDLVECQRVFLEN